MRHLDTGSGIVIVLTAALFIAALFVKGFTHDLLLEAGVLLVSVKLIMMAYRNRINYLDVKKGLDEIREILKKRGDAGQ